MEEGDVGEYQSIMKNGVWEIVPRPSDKAIVTTKWIYKIKHVVDGSIENTRPDLLQGVSLKRKVLTMKKPLHL